MDTLYTIGYFGVSFAIIIFLLWVIWLLLYSMIRGGPYAPTGKSKIDIMLDLVNIKPGEKAVDIGAGDGRIVIALAKKGAEAHGIEINPLLVFLARRKIKREGLEGKAFIHTADMWKQDYSKFDIVTLFMTPHALRGLEKKLQKELRPGARVALNYYTFPAWKAAKHEGTVYLYKKQTGK
jgi:cyclopropane fatty-acyl-phospholipid synthase-like methyltransferase